MTSGFRLVLSGKPTHFRAAPRTLRLFTFTIVSKFQEGVAGLWKDTVNVDLLPWVHKNNEKLPVGEDRRLIRKAPRTSLLLRKPASPAAEVGKSSVATVNIWRKLVVKVDRI